MSCPVNFTGLRNATEHLGNEIHQIASPATPYFNFIERGMFPKNSGVNMTVFTAGRVEPDSKSAGWADVSLSANVIQITPPGAPIVGNDNFTAIPVGFNEATYAPRRLQLMGPTLNKDTLTFAHNPAMFIQQHYVPSLANYVKRKIDLEFRDQVIKLGTKMSIRPGALNSIFTGLTLPTIAPTSALTWDWLDAVNANLIRDGATNADGAIIELGPMGPVWPINIGLEMLASLFQNVPAILANFQHAFSTQGKDSPTIIPIGASIAIKNYRFNPVTHPPRYDFVGGILVEREAFEETSATFGQQSTPTALYINAEFEGAVIPHPKQYRANVVAPDNAGLNFDTTSWTGEWTFITGGSRIVPGSICFDPLHKFGAHFSEFCYAPEPIHTNYGWTLIYKRCPNGQATAACTSGS